MADEPPTHQSRNEPDVDVRSTEGRARDESGYRAESGYRGVRKAWRERRASMRESRKETTRRIRARVAEDIRPVTRPLGRARGWIEENRRWTYPLLAIIGIAVAATLPFWRDWFDLPGWAEQATSGATLARVGLFALFALGLN